MKKIINFSLLFLLISCERYSTRDLERDNPYPFTLMAIIEENGRIIKFEDRAGRMICDRLPAYDECTPCEENYNNPYNECISDPDTGRSFTADSCMCKGNYHILSQNGIELIIKDPKKARVPATFISGIDAEILYLNKPLNGKIITTKSEISTIIQQSYESGVQLTDSYFLDIAGGFEATDGVVSIRGGVFFSVKPE